MRTHEEKDSRVEGGNGKKGEIHNGINYGERESGRLGGVDVDGSTGAKK